MEATFGNSSPRRNVVRQLTLVFSGLLLLTLLLGLVSLYRIAQTLDERERGQSRFHAESVMAQLHKNERSYMVAYAFWQAAYEHLTGTVDRRWAYEEDNLGVTLYSDDGYQGVFVLNDDGTHYATLEGRISEQPFDRHSNSRAQLLQRARKAAQQQEATSGYLQFDGQPALYAAAVIRPAANSEPPPSPTGAVLVFVRLLDTEKLGELGRSAGLSGFAVTTASQGPADMGRLPLEDSGYTLTWHVEQPGTDLLRTVVIPLALAVLIIAVLMALFARHTMRASAGIDRSYRDLAASKAALESSEARFKAVAEAASDWIWETDAQQHLTYLSPRFAELTGHPLERWLQRPIGELFTCDTRQVDDWLHGLASSEATGTLRCQYQDRHEQRRECRVAARAIVEHKTCKGYRGTCTDITDEVAAHAQIQHLSLHDALTGLPNRNKLFRFLEDAGQAELGLLMLDLDNFKPINDSLGHPAGDAVLIEVAHRLGQVTRESDLVARLGQVTRESDLVARLGGDEFVIVLARPGKHDEVDRFCARVIETLQQPIQFEQHKVQIGVSLGVVLSAEYPGIASDLIRYADVALYSAKQAGKHTWRYFSAELNTTLLEKRALERELRAGIGRGELRLHFQPRYKVDGVTVASAEALVRWQHPRLGLLRPDHFIALAEESDLIVQLGNWVLEQACSLARGWPLDILVSVNMSPAQFSRSDVVRDVAEALRHTGLPAHRLELEITENVMLNDVEGALQTMNALKELGVRLNMDDFGTGYSSLGYLRTYPFDSIKIDKRFVQSLGTSSSDRSVVQAIINLGNAMGMTVTAEGVETAEQLALLSDDQCHEVQGYLLSRPVENQVLMRIMAGEEAARSRSL